MTNPTAVNFGYPDTRVAETDHWLVLVRPKQPTLGALVLVCKEAAEAFSQLSPAAFADLKVAIDGIERLLGRFVAYEKINYLMLMMVDRDVHFHVIPRYEGVRVHEGRTFTDAGWPAAPALGATVDLDPPSAAALATLLASDWSAA
ncbi:HIT family protein [Caulobacter sp. ErkDOM-E]|uniref:HIT family protein n=1 Tax=Caulobacter sp. ErkDOM-E TaxID=3402778 RepID=UPI003AF9EB40